MVAPTLLPSEWLIPTKWKFKVSSRVLWQKRWIMAELWIQQSRFILNAYLILLWRYVFPPCVKRTSVFSSNFSMPGTGKSWSEALIFASTNPQYDDRLFIELQFNTWKFQAQTWGEHVVYRNCFWHSEQVLSMFCKKKRSWQRFTCMYYLGLSFY